MLDPIISNALALVTPDGVSPKFAAVLILASAVTSAITAAFGLGGGLALLAVMATGLPMATVIPVHGVVQLSSNVTRAGLLGHHIAWPLVGLFALGSSAGALLALPFVAQAPDTLMRVAAGVFALIMVWGPRPHLPGRSTTGFTIGAGATGALSLFIGATGPFTGALLSVRALARRAMVATFAACMTAQHAIKWVVFAGLGFAFWDWAVLISLMAASGYAGTWLGLRTLSRLSEKAFRSLFRAMLTVLALYLVVDGALDVVRAMNAEAW